jgi:hypothetical protein
VDGYDDDNDNDIAGRGLRWRQAHHHHASSSSSSAPLHWRAILAMAAGQFRACDGALRRHRMEAMALRALDLHQEKHVSGTRTL